MSIRDALLAVSAPAHFGGVGATNIFKLINDLAYAVAQLAAAQQVDASLIEQIQYIPDFDGAQQ